MVINHFAYASDGKYALQLKIAVASLLYATRLTPRLLHIHILDLGLNDTQWNETVKSWKAILDATEFHRHVISTDQFSKYKQWNNSYATYARLLLPDIISDAEWCLYADCDTFFIDDPAALQNALNNKLALVGHLNPIAITTQYDKKWFEERDLQLDFSKYVCAGLVAMNLDWFRKNNARQKCIEFLDAHPDVLTPDQSALNYVCRGNIGLFPDGWGDFAYEAIKDDSCHCIHYAGTMPWNPPRSWTFFCGEHKLLNFWYEFAENVVQEPSLKSKFMPLRIFFLPKATAFLLWPLLCLASFLHLHPKSFEDHALAIRQRWHSNVISILEGKLKSATQ